MFLSIRISAKSCSQANHCEIRSKDLEIPSPKMLCSGIVASRLDSRGFLFKLFW
jgi:hypothetical protein